MGLLLPEITAGSFFPHAVSGLGGLVFAVILFFLSLALMFAGRSIINALSFLVVGLAGAAAGLAAGGLVLGPIGALIGVVVGFIVGGLIGLLLLHVGMGLVLGYFAYLAIRDLTHIFILAAAIGVVLFFVGFIISSRLLELVTPLVGGIILYGVLIYFGLGPTYSLVVSLILTVAGFLVQRRRRRAINWNRV